VHLLLGISKFSVATLTMSKDGLRQNWPDISPNINWICSRGFCPSCVPCVKAGLDASRTDTPIHSNSKIKCRQRAAVYAFIHSPITYVQPSEPIQTSCTRPASTSIRSPTPYVFFSASFSLGYVIVNSPLRIKWVVRPLWECGL
jgi:hypothetical protein